MRIPEGKNQMNQQRRWKRPIAERARGFVGAVARRHYLSIAAVVLAIAACVTLAPRALSNAAGTPLVAGTAAAAPAATSTLGPPNDEGVTWTSNNDAIQFQENSGPNAGTCLVESDGTINGGNGDVISQMANALNVEGTDPINTDGISNDMIRPDNPINLPPGSTVFPEGGAAQVDCSLINQTTAYLKQAGYGSLGHFSHAVLDAFRRPATPGSRTVLLAYGALPQWAKVAIGAIVGAVLYVSVSVIVVATMVALGAATAATGGLASPALAALAGCIGGAISTGATLFIAGAATSPPTIISSLVAGCVTGGLIAKIPAVATGQWLGATLRQYIGLAPAPVVGTGVTGAAAGAGVELTGWAQAMQAGLDGLASVTG